MGPIVVLGAAAMPYGDCVDAEGRSAGGAPPSASETAALPAGLAYRLWMAVTVGLAGDVL